MALAGLDPVGALIAIAALVGGIRERWVVGYGLVVLSGTVMLGTLLSITVGRRLADAVGWPYLRQGSHGAVVELAVAAAVLVWAYLRFRRSTMSVSRSGEPAQDRH